MIEDVVAPLLQSNVVFAEAVAVSVTDVTKQVSTLSGPALTAGGAKSDPTITVQVLVQPFNELVTVTE